MNTVHDTGQSESMLAFNNGHMVIVVWWVLADYRLVLISGSNPGALSCSPVHPCLFHYSENSSPSPDTHFIDLSRNSGFSLKAELGPWA